MPSASTQSEKRNLAKAVTLMGATMLPAVAASPVGANTYTYSTSTSSADWYTVNIPLTGLDYYIPYSYLTYDWPTMSGPDTTFFFYPTDTYESSDSIPVITYDPLGVPTPLATPSVYSPAAASSSSAVSLTDGIPVIASDPDGVPTPLATPSVYSYTTTTSSTSSYSFSLPPGNWETFSLTFQEVSNTATVIIPGFTTPSSSSAVATSSGNPPPAADSEFAKQMIFFHNEKRALHEDTGPLTWSDELAAIAQEKANQYDCSGVLYEGNSQYGENLAFGCGWEDCFALWYDELTHYNYSIPMYSPETGHFTQVVWKDSTEVGCGYKACPGWWGYYMVCEYNPKGNMLWSFEENVLPPTNPEDDGYITIPSVMPYAATATFA